MAKACHTHLTGLSADAKVLPLNKKYVCYFFVTLFFSTFSAIEYFAVKNILVLQNSVKNHICRKSNSMVPQIHKRSSKDLIQV